MTTRTLPDDLDNSAFHASVEAAAGESIASFEIREVLDKTGSSGICGEYWVPRVAYVTRSGARGETTLFLRRDLEAGPGFRQAHHYRTLSGLGLPTPRLHGDWVDDVGREVLVLEHVAVVAEQEDRWLRKPENVTALLSILARFAGLRVPTSYLALVGRDMARRRGYTRSWNTWLPWSIHILGKVWEHALAGRLGGELGQWCSGNQAACQTLQQSARAMLNATNSLERSLIHSDFHVGNLGWREYGERELLLFDFGDVMIDFLFYDVAMYLGCPKEMSPLDGFDVEDLAEFYLKQLESHGRKPPTVQEFLRQVRLVWHTRKLNLWELLPKELSGPDYHGPEGEDTRESRERCLLRLLKALTNELPQIEEDCRKIAG